MPHNPDNAEQDLSLALALPGDETPSASQSFNIADETQKLKTHHIQWQASLACLNLATLLLIEDGTEVSDGALSEPIPANYTADASAWLSTLATRNPDTQFNRLKAGANLANTAATALSGAIAATGPTWLAIPATLASGSYWLVKNEQVNQQNLHHHEVNQQQLTSLTKKTCQLQSVKNPLLSAQQDKLQQIRARIDAMATKSRTVGEDESVSAGADTKAVATGQSFTFIFLIITVLKIIALSIAVTRPRDDTTDTTYIAPTNVAFLVVEGLLALFQILGVAHQTGRARHMLDVTKQGLALVKQDMQQLKQEIIRRGVQGIESTPGMKAHRRLVQAGQQVHQHEEAMASITANIAAQQTKIRQLTTDIKQTQTELTTYQAERDRLLTKGRESLSETERTSLNRLVSDVIPRISATVTAIQVDLDDATAALEAVQHRQSVCKEKLTAIVQQTAPLSLFYRRQQQQLDILAQDTAVSSSAELDISQSTTPSHGTAHLTG